MVSMAKAMGSNNIWKLDSSGPGEVEMVEREGGSWVGMWGEQTDTPLGNKELGGL